MKKQSKRVVMPPKNINIAIIMVMTAILIVVNMIGVLVVNKFSLKLDMTDNKLYEFSDTTYQVIESLEEPVNITIFNSKSDFVIMLKEVFDRYDSLSDKITVTYQDPYENPVLVDAYKQKGFDIKQNDMVIEGTNRIKQYDIDDLYTFNSTKTSITGMKAEQQITSGLIYVNDTNIPVVKFTDGHNERSTTALMDLFEQNNFIVDRVTINIMGISEDTDILVIASPTRDFEQDEIKILDEYMNNGGSIMAFIEPSVSEFINLNGFLNKWGIGVGNEVVFEKEAYVSNNPINIVPMYVQHEINQYFGDNRYFLVMPSSRTLYKVDNASYDLNIMAVLVSSPNSYGKEGVDFITTEQEENDAVGPFYLAMTSSRQVSTKDGQDNARIFVVGSRNIYADDMLGISSYANADFLTQTMNWLNETESSINIPAKNIAPDPINVLPKEAIIIGIIIMGIIPVGIFILGIIVYFRRKKPMIKQTRLLKVSSIVLIVLVCIFTVLYLYDVDKVEDEAPTVIEINKINVREIAAVAITNQKTSFGLLVGENGITLETEKEGGEYSQEEMRAFIYTISKLISKRAIEDYDNIATYGLDKPSSKITIIKSDGSKLRYFLGDKNPVDESYYLLEEGDERIFLIDGITAELMLREESDFSKRELLPRIEVEKIDLIESISIHTKKKPERAYTIQNQGEYTFRLVKPIDNSVSTDTIFSDIILPLSAIYPDKLVESNADLAEFGLDNPDYLIDLNFNKSNYQVIISKGEDEKYYIAKVGESSVYEIAGDQITFLEADYLDMLGGSIYNCNVSKIKSITFSDTLENKDYNFELSGETTELKAVINGKIFEYAEFMEFYRLVNSIGIVSMVENIEGDTKPYFTITINKKNGSIDVIDFVKQDDSECYVKVNGVINFTAFNKSAVDIITEVENLIK